MYTMIERYINNLDKSKVNEFAQSKNINFSEEELNFIYAFVKKNWQPIIANHGKFEINHLKDHFSEENFNNILKVYKEYLIKYSSYL